MQAGELGSMIANQLRVLVVEDQMITRLGLIMVLEKMSGIAVVGDAENGRIALEQAAKLRPSVVIMDVGMPVMDGIEATRQLKEMLPDTGVLILTTHDHDDDVFASLAAGADGYCLKNASAETLQTAIRTVADRASWLDPAIARRVLNAGVSRQPADGRVPQKKEKDRFALSARELEILELLVQGLSNQQMAERLFLSVETVKTHMRHIMEKLAVADRTQAAIKALREGLLSSN